MMDLFMEFWYSLGSGGQQQLFFLAGLVQLVLLIISVRKKIWYGWVILYILEIAALAVALAGASHYEGSGFWGMGSSFTHLFAVWGFSANIPVTVVVHVGGLILRSKCK